jgi:hypothetical protein
LDSITRPLAPGNMICISSGGARWAFTSASRVCRGWMA